MICVLLNLMKRNMKMFSGREEGREEGLAEGLAKGRETEVFVSVQEGDYGVERGAQKLDLSVEEFEKEMSAAGYQIPVEA